MQLPVQFNLDAAALRAQHRQLQAQWHPDRFVQSSDRERLQAVQNSALVNEARSVLQDPVERARYLLELHTGETLDHNQTTADPGFLMEQIMLREELDGCRKFDDPNGCLGCSDKLLGSVNERLQKALNDFQQQLKDQNYSAAAETVKKLRFMNRVLLQLNDFQQEIEDDLLI